MVLSPGGVPDLDASKIVSGILPVARGGTGDTSGAPTEATQSDQEDEGASNADRFVSPEVAKFAPSALKAWLEIPADGASLPTPSYNIDSLGDTGTGNRDVNFTVPFSDANFAVGSSGYAQEEKDHDIRARTTADMNVQAYLRTDQSASDQQTAHICAGDQ